MTMLKKSMQMILRKGGLDPAEARMVLALRMPANRIPHMVWIAFGKPRRYVLARWWMSSLK